jgi:hypothetical protein
MKTHSILSVLILLALFSPAVLAQPSTVVQLPTSSSFGVGTTVSVPDGGSAYLGGISRAASGSNEFGTPLLPFSPFKNRSSGSQVSTSKASVSVYIHDFAALEEQLLSQPSASARLTPRTTYGQQPLVARNGSAATPAGSVAESRQERLRQQRAPEEDARDLCARAEQANAEGKPGLAVIYYRMASRRATGEFKQQIAARMDALQTPQRATKLAEGSTDRLGSR